MEETDLSAWLTLLRMPGIGPRRFDEILQEFGSPAAYLGENKRLSDTVARGVAADLHWAQGRHCHIVTLAHPQYPQILKQIADPPPVLFVQGDLTAIDTPQIAIVGSRKATRQGQAHAFEFAAMLAANELVVTSGLATGIDTGAHQGAIAADGRTIAVMATGPERIYPYENTRLAKAITERGALISEMPVGTALKRGLFPRRNRLISGLSLGTLVIEAGSRSGALGTAQQALEQNREVMAIPGSVHNPVTRGCHSLLRNGAYLVETAQDVLQILRRSTALITPPMPGEPPCPMIGVDADSQNVLRAMGYDPVAFDVLLNRLGLTPERLSSMLLNLELLGLVILTDGGRYERSNQWTGG